ncbi:uncharacterized protein LY79DRAFT_535885 [Colletotrichum navitas]|uniref:Uncharacterized protein n=1 Tax=Colletotrichum navitas TaxID=681940 RepID=A0AAD8VC39_9PEZI|nr:uncharacterized protein LY79DRAFT_535885 [Colletotrichum navitas]KAK1599718.1 hypothetical protein LY79DRAFT_535885 [Colletotrichum navitas]
MRLHPPGRPRLHHHFRSSGSTLVARGGNTYSSHSRRQCLLSRQLETDGERGSLSTARTADQLSQATVTAVRPVSSRLWPCHYLQKHISPHQPD